MNSLSTRFAYVLTLMLALLATYEYSLKFDQPAQQDILAHVAQSPLEGAPATLPSDIVRVTKIVDGDTIDVMQNQSISRVRLIGINTPETVDPRKPVECFGKQAAQHSRELLTNSSVRLEPDPSQGDKDKYGRLLRYVFLENGVNVNLQMIRDGYAYEYTYHTPYRYQKEFKQAEHTAQEQQLGLWGPVCNGKLIPETSSPLPPTGTATRTPCIIKGNIGSNGDKIYHVKGCGSYEKTTINESQGERMFCTEEEAIAAGWRKANNCN